MSLDEAVARCMDSIAKAFQAEDVDAAELLLEQVEELNVKKLTILWYFRRWVTQAHGACKNRRPEEDRAVRSIPTGRGRGRGRALLSRGGGRGTLARGGGRVTSPRGPVLCATAKNVAPLPFPHGTASSSTRSNHASHSGGDGGGGD